MRQALSRLSVGLERTLAFFILAFLVTGDVLAPDLSRARLEYIVGADQFDFVGWVLEALGEKSAQGAVPVQAYLDDPQRAQFVVDYLALTRQLFEVEGEVDRVYADPAVVDAEAASVELRARRDQLRAEIERRRPTAEAIIEMQIGGGLAEEGFAIAGRIFPPVQARITPLPHVLVISPRDAIEREPGLGLSATISVERSEEIEDTVFERLDKSALVTSIGGLALYPSMIVETSDLLGLLQVTSHEWVHHWLFFRPLGIQLLLDSAAGGETLTINETVASLIGDELGILILKRYYPDIAKAQYPFVYEPPQPEEDPEQPPADEDPNAFNLNREMHKTRVQVDAYLANAREFNLKAEEADAAGRADEARSLRAEALEWIVKAETYMEERRGRFVENGYWWIRKLNQAYFAFHGSYADQPGASGADPIGPAVRELRAKIPGVKDFLEAVAPVTTRADLERVLAQR